MYSASIEKREKRPILAVSGDPRVLAEMKMRLMDHFDVSIAATNEVAGAVLEKYKILAVVIHVDGTGTAAFSKFSPIMEFARNNSVPVIFLSDKDNECDEIIAFEFGADDYVIKRNGSAAALINRLHLRIRAGEKEKQFPDCEAVLSEAADNPEEILRGKTILIADDVEINRDIIAGMLFEIEGLTLDFAADGNEAVAKFSEIPDRYALIFMDVQMPEMDGLEATKTIRNLNCGNAREIPIIALTASTGIKETNQCLEAGMNGFLAKPPDYFKLINIAAEHIK